jgi:hypothetical protein
MRITGYIGLQLQSPRYLASPAQDEYIPVTPKPLLAEAATKIVSPDVAMALPPAADHFDDDDDVNTYSVTDTQSNSRATRRWTREEDIELTSALANTCKKEWGNEYRTDWAAVVALVPGRTKNQCNMRWHNALKPSIARPTAHCIMWTTDENSKLKYAVRMHGGKDWAAISALVPGRTKEQCKNRWHDFLKPSIDRTARRSGTWTEGERLKLINAVQMHGGKDWAAIARLVPGRTRKQCRNRWYHWLNHCLNQPTNMHESQPDNDLRIME